MPIADLLKEGANLMLLGMGSVFIFLTLLVITMTGMSRLAQAIAGDASNETPTPNAAAPKASGGDDDLIAVISAAISRYRSK
ncbi:MAG: OadG family protein [Candidatus Sedimenticola sp. 6PFRAG7]